MLYKSRGEIVFDVFNKLFLILFSLTIVYPFIRELSISLSTPAEAITYGLHLYPRTFTFKSYERLIGSGFLSSAYFNTLYRIVFGTPLAVLITCALAYPLSKRYFPHRNFWTTIIIVTMFFGGGLIPNYILIKNLGLINNLWALILPNLVDPFIFIIVRNFFLTIPESLEESARIDGASDIRIFMGIIIPLSKPVIATIALWIVVGHWNAWFDSLIYLNKPNMQVLQVVLRRVMMEGKDLYGGINKNLEKEFTPETLKAAILILTTAPILLVYPFVQKYFIKGIMLGSVKG